MRTWTASTAWACVTVTLVASVTACLRRDAMPSAGASGAGVAPTACVACHPGQVSAWSNSNHAHANRPIDPLADALATLALAEASGPVPQSLDMAVGREPLRQYASVADDGRVHVMDLAYDPTTTRWFHVSGDDPASPPLPAAVWNSQCAYCHMTGLHKRYEADVDRYQTTWEAHGVGCRACHAERTHPRGDGHPAPSRPWTIEQVQSATTTAVCLRCHARREELTDEAFAPGDLLHDHYALELPDRPGVYYADGQVRDEAFEGGSFLLSRMGGHGGVGCLDCHDPHTTGLRAAIDDDALCLQCHGTGKRGAPILADLTAHTHHQSTSAGSRCVACHMPVTTFMQRDPRHDHGFTSPDPLLTLELGIPNACNRCHVDRDATWATSAAERWYGAKLERRQRQRARVVAAADGGHGDVHAALLALVLTEDVPAWQATLVGLLAPWATLPDVTGRLTQLLHASDPLVRAAAVRAMAEHPDRARLLSPALSDPVRVVRLDAALALRDELHRREEGPPAALVAEVLTWLDQTADTPMGALRRAEWALVARDPTGVRLHARHATEFAPADPGIAREAATLLRLLRSP